MKLSIIVAMAENHVIGVENRLPWSLPADQAFFKRKTTGHTVIMGRRTFESMDGPLPRRRNIVITRRRDYRPEGAEVAGSLDEAIEAAAGDDEVFVAGGADLYREALPRADRLYLTLVHACPRGDTRFPDVDLSQWHLVEEERHEVDARHAHAFSMRTYEAAR